MYRIKGSNFNFDKAAATATKNVTARLRQNPNFTPVFCLSPVGISPEGGSAKVIAKILYAAGLDTGHFFSAGMRFLFREAYNGSLSRTHKLTVVKERRFGKHVRRTEQDFDPNMRPSELLKRPNDTVFVRIEPKKAIHI